MMVIIVAYFDRLINNQQPLSCTGKIKNLFRPLKYITNLNVYNINKSKNAHTKHQQPKTSCPTELPHVQIYILLDLYKIFVYTTQTLLSVP